MNHPEGGSLMKMDKEQNLALYELATTIVLSVKEIIIKHLDNKRS
ncbi:TPA: hypothetical protein ACGO89_001873 [Streptococcus suis]|jgi:hypothetical protein